MNILAFLKENKIYIFLFIVSCAIYINTIPNKYALDDKMMITNNIYTQDGIDGIYGILTEDSMSGMFGEGAHNVSGGRYRPLSIITFAIEQEIFGDNPHISHLINILLYGLLVILLYKLLIVLFNQKKYKNQWFTVPFITSLLFALHPIHTDAVANIKGRDEILCFLFCILALFNLLNYLKAKKIHHILFALINFTLACFTKELAITFLFVIPITIYFFRDYKIKQYIPLIITLFTGASIYLIVRNNIVGMNIGEQVGSLMNNPFLGMERTEKYATILYTLLLYVKLCVFPHPLTYDYYPYHITTMSFSNIWVIFAVILFVSLAIITIIGFKKKSIYSLGILIFAATLSITSNVFFTIGAFMSERFIFISVLGVCLIIAHILVNVLPKHLKSAKNITLVTLIIISVLFSTKTIDRNFDWYNNLTLFGNDVKISHNSAKGNSSYGSELYALSETADSLEARQLMLDAIPYFEKAIEIYPDYTEPIIRLGNIYYKLDNDYKKMFSFYLRAFEINPKLKDAWNNTIGVLENNIHDIEYELYIWSEIRKLNPGMYQSWYYPGKLYQQYTTKKDSALILLKEANRLRPNDKDITKFLGISYGDNGEFENAQKIMLSSEKLGTKDANMLRFIGITYGMKSNDKKASEYFKKALDLEPNNQSYLRDYNVALKRLEAKKIN